jgi:hypothetical protein
VKIEMTWFIELVAEGRRLVAEQGAANWRLGDLAAQVQTRYGRRTLARFADAIGIEPATLRAYTATARAWPFVERQTEVSWSVHFILNAQPDRFELIERVATCSEARRLVAERLRSGAA